MTASWSIVSSERKVKREELLLETARKLVQKAGEAPRNVNFYIDVARELLRFLRDGHRSEQASSPEETFTRQEVIARLSNFAKNPVELEALIWDLLAETVIRNGKERSFERLRDGEATTGA